MTQQKGPYSEPKKTAFRHSTQLSYPRLKRSATTGIQEIGTMPIKNSAEPFHDVLPFLLYCTNKGSDTRKHIRALLRPKASRDLLMQFGHSDAGFRDIVVEGYVKVIHEHQRLQIILRQPYKHPLWLRLFPALCFYRLRNSVFHDGYSIAVRLIWIRNNGAIRVFICRDSAPLAMIARYIPSYSLISSQPSLLAPKRRE